VDPQIGPRSLVRDAWPWVVAVVLITGAIAQNAAVIVLGVAIGAACIGALVWSRYAPRRLFYERIVPEDHAFPDEEVVVTLRVTNRKPLPLPWIEMQDSFPEAMRSDDPLSTYGSSNTGRLGVSWTTSAAAYDKIFRDYVLKAPERGVYELGPASVRTGDPFGLFPQQRMGVQNTRILVYPRIVDVGEQALPARRPFGERTGGLRIFEDPARVSGLRDYEPGDLLRRVDWNATARLGRIQSRIYDPTSSHHLLVCLNTATLTPHWAGFVPELFEGGITIAASLAKQAHEQRFAVGLLATSSVADAHRAIRVPPSRTEGQLIRMLEALAIITPYVLDSLAAMLDREEHRLALGTTLAIVTAIMPEDLVITLQRLRRRGHKLVVLSPSGNRWQAELEGIEVRHVSWPEQASAFAPPPPEASLP
jgi:uncharacterized protein (DUF58 family)